MLYSYLVSVSRTLTPMLAGMFCALAAHHGLHIASGEVTSGLTAASGALYYVVFRSLEHAHPAWGWFLGVPQRPQYGGRPEGGA